MTPADGFAFLFGVTYGVFVLAPVDWRTRAWWWRLGLLAALSIAVSLLAWII